MKRKLREVKVRKLYGPFDNEYRDVRVRVVDGEFETFVEGAWVRQHRAINAKTVNALHDLLQNPYVGGGR